MVRAREEAINGQWIKQRTKTWRLCLLNWPPAQATNDSATAIAGDPDPDPFNLQFPKLHLHHGFHLHRQRKPFFLGQIRPQRGHRIRIKVPKPREDREPERKRKRRCRAENQRGQRTSEDRGRRRTEEAVKNQRARRKEADRGSNEEAAGSLMKLGFFILGVFGNNSFLGKKSCLKLF